MSEPSCQNEWLGPVGSSGFRSAPRQIGRQVCSTSPKLELLTRFQTQFLTRFLIQSAEIEFSNEWQIK